MKFFTCSLFVGMAAVLAGCTADTPGYSSKERFAQIHRNDIYEAEQLNDDIDRHLTMDRPSNQETYWNVYHRD
jgi:hypothetical protein